jgi:hypothetical protein
LPNVGVISGIDYFQEIDALLRRPYSEFLSVANNLKFENQIKLLRTFNVGYLVSFRELPERGLRIASRHPDRFGSLLATGVTLLIVVQGLLNVGVVLGCLPTKGLVLPFISYGGSAMLVTLVEVGILLALARETR